MIKLSKLPKNWYERNIRLNIFITNNIYVERITNASHFSEYWVDIDGERTMVTQLFFENIRRKYPWYQTMLMEYLYLDKNFETYAVYENENGEYYTDKEGLE